MSLVAKLRAEAIRRKKLPADAEFDAATAFALVRDMPYQRATDRQPETTIREWRGTCSGKHYLLKELFAELGIPARVIACTTVVQTDPEDKPEPIRTLLRQSAGRFVDVHNYLILELPESEMVVDATWPMAMAENGAAAQFGLVVNERFVLGENQRVAYPPREEWVIPSGEDPQAFKEKLLRSSFTSEELAHREAVIETISTLIAAAMAGEGV